MLGPAATSIPQFILIINWLLEGNFKNKFSQLKQNKVYLVLFAVFVLHLMGWIYSQEVGAGFEDIKVKLPIILLATVFFSTKALSQKELFNFFYSFLLGCALNLGWCMIYKATHINLEGRDVSRFMSHIRLGLFTNMAIAIALYLITKIKNNSIKIALIAIVSFFIFALLTLGLATGLVNLIITVFTLVIYYLFQKKLSAKYLITIIVVFSSFLLFSYFHIKQFYSSQFTLNNSTYNVPKTLSLLGNEYSNTITNTQMENGNKVLLNVQPIEIINWWNTKFSDDSIIINRSQNVRRYEEIVRYLTSKELPKEKAGMDLLTTTDIENIKNNITNVNYPSWNYVDKRLYELVWEYAEFKGNRSINGHSLHMRYYFLKAAFQLIAKNPLFGVGTGDVQIEMNKTYLETQTPLIKEWWKRPHNQFVTITVAFGFIGLIVFLISLVYPLIHLKSQLNSVYLVFFSILVFSFLFEDTLESQSGATFYALFNVVLLSIFYSNKNQNNATKPI